MGHPLLWATRSRGLPHLLEKFLPYVQSKPTLSLKPYTFPILLLQSHLNIVGYDKITLGTSLCGAQSL